MIIDRVRAKIHLKVRGTVCGRVSGTLYCRELGIILGRVYSREHGEGHYDKKVWTICGSEYVKTVKDSGFINSIFLKV